MTALTNKRAVRDYNARTIELVSTAETVYNGGRACFDLSTGLVKKAAASTTLIPIGVYAGNQADANGACIIASGGTVSVLLDNEISAKWMVNSTAGDAVAAANIGGPCYLVDDQTVALTDGTGTRSLAGRVWKIDTIRGVLVEFSKALGAKSGTLAGALLDKVALPAFAANDSAPTAVITGAIYDVPTTGAASTISLPTAPVDGTFAYFFADGTKNGHTVTYRDVATAGTTALTASKRHLVVAAALGGHWNFNAYIGP